MRYGLLLHPFRLRVGKYGQCPVSPTRYSVHLELEQTDLIVLFLPIWTIFSFSPIKKCDAGNVQFGERDGN